jgi:hypothetical protein
MTNPQQTTLSRQGFVRSASLGQALAILALAAVLAILLVVPQDRSPASEGFRSAPPKMIEDWRGNSASIRPYAD